MINSSCIRIQKIVYLCKFNYSSHFSGRCSMIRVAIIGASGYSGSELMRLVSQRQDLKLEKVIAGSSVGQRVDILYPAFIGRVDLTF